MIAIRPARFYLASLIGPLLLLLAIGAIHAIRVTSRSTISFLVMSFKNPFTGQLIWIEDPWVWPVTGLFAAALYSIPAGLGFLAARRASVRTRNLITLGIMVTYLLALVVLFGIARV